MTRREWVLLLAAPAAFGQGTTDEGIWSDFERWTSELAPLPPGQHKNIEQTYIEFLMRRGLPAAEAKRRAQQALYLRWGFPERQRTFWNADFKLGAGPDAPLRLLQETVARMKGSKALDAGMGGGRNALWLASIGWDVTGYDISPEAVRLPEAKARTAGVHIKAIEAAHEAFDFGDSEWDLIVCSYNFMAVMDPQWAAKFYKALRPGGLALWQNTRGSYRNMPSKRPQYASTDNTTAGDILANWTRSRLRRFEDLDPGIVDDDWTPSRTNRTYRLVVQKAGK